MTWLQISVELPGEDPQRLAASLEAAGALAVTFESGDRDALYEPPPGETPLWARTRVVGLFAGDTQVAAVRGALTRSLGRPGLEVRVAPLPDQDWERAWLCDFHPMRFGARLWVCPGGACAPDPGAVTVSLDPGLAFGTGTHPSTALCLEWLDGADLSGRAFVDYGCGSGILAIAAAKLGAAPVWAVDHDPQALQATEANAVRNGVSAKVRVYAPADREPAGPAHGAVRVLVANILAGPLEALAGRFADHLAPGGTVVLAGILAEQAHGVMRAYEHWFTMEHRRSREEWALLVGCRREG